ncbi:methyltransferase domain-containing protein [Dyadobacter fanqingshengii]|uniref:Methyltransferase domain-containing protein n=1 Tax=Dyadobacter fanqingshengii TaxID=2906443 RepID=A0A9X1PB26_9BACT|nr:methyltransferase domain-containing protein [Dyadobacter fanqingshengii]MCF0041696.1 methyltransferase domain-containing protein [Dyadobacter fanqingshengii]USJ36590.1 methyltransferase domain-containing protein [Dyadobacter fanqingshengii]
MFKFRSQDKELLDQEEIPSSDLFQNLRELDFINHWLGGYKISFDALKKVIKPGQPYILVDIGCGGGDTLKRIHQWNKHGGYQLDLYGVDIKPVCITYAEENLKSSPVKLICDDYRHIFNHLKQVDIIHACLFCHHLAENQLVELVRFALENKSVLVINDLERNPLAYYSIKWLTQLFSKSYLVKNDAPLSVLRGFKKIEWISLLQKAGAVKYSVRNKWAFRHEVIVYGNAS